MTLTAAGEIYARYAQAVLLEMDRVRTDLEELRGLRRGVIRIATVEGVVADSLTAVIAVFRIRHPGVRFNLVTLGTDHVVAAVRDNKVDVGVSFHAQPDSAVRFIRRIRDPLLALMHPDNPLAARRKISLSDILSQPIAVPESGFGIRRLIDEQCRRLGQSLVPVLETNSIEALRGFARSGAGITMLPGMSFQREIRQGEVVSITLSDRALNQCSIDIGVLAGRHLPTAISQFVAALDHELSALSSSRRRV
jgi:DNA-binding transcriptional LysR family regulator